MESVCILGLGYIGLPTAAMFASSGMRVFGVDVNEEIISILNNGGIHIQEPGLGELIKEVIVKGNLSYSSTPQEADTFIIAVPTPFFHDQYAQYKDKQYKIADMSYVQSAAEMIVPFLRKGNLVILESTSPPKTTIDLVKPILEKSGLLAGEDFFLSYSPERVLPGQILKELVENSRVMGGINEESSQRGRDLYSSFVEGEIYLTDSTTAEMIKLMENTFRDVNIALANEFLRLADRFGVNVWEAISLANQHPRVKILQPGPGVGGHCISVDPWFLVEGAPDLANLIYEARKVNDSQPDYVINVMKEKIGDLKGKRIAALGLAYKPDVDDLRESPAVEICNKLVLLGAIVNAFEPNCPGKIIQNNKGFSVFKTLSETLQASEVIIILVNHKSFQNLEEMLLQNESYDKWIFDNVNMLPKSKNANIKSYIKLGGNHGLSILKKLNS